MDQFREVMLAVWREACQHIEVHESVAGILRLLAGHMPVERMAVISIDPDHHMAAAVGVAPAPIGDWPSPRECSASDIKRLVSWVRRGGISSPGESGQLPTAVTPLPLPNSDRDIRIAPLGAKGGAIGALVVTARDGSRFTRKHDAMLAALQEPLAVALENDRRLRELAALREAAEADRRSLLRRMGRQDIQEQIVGESGGLAPVMKRVALVCSSDAPVLLLGETGAGKEVVARAIHSRSDRKHGPFIRVNCGAIPRELVDSQLFGHEKGSFTGATDTRQGWFERADGGTLFLDEIGELPAEAQVRFLRVLQDSFVERVGGGEPIRVDVRIVAATHRDLAAMVRDGTFREDLWYRIAVFPILLPPLRERLADIPELAAHFATRAAVKFGLPPVAPTETDIETLCAYRWPGNIRELASVIDRAAILGEGHRLEISAAIGFGSENSPSVRTKVERPCGKAEQELATLDEAVREHIEAALRKTRGRIEGRRGAAALLGINPHTLRARMRKLRIAWATFRQLD